VEPTRHQISVGATDALSLRVSVAALVSVQFRSPADGQRMLVLERTATLRPTEGRPEIVVIAKPFGGAVRLTDPRALEQLIGDFHYDSERSRLEGDFRIQVRPAAWERIKLICRENYDGTAKRILDVSPERELAEEFHDSLKVRIVPAQYSLRPRGMTAQETLKKTGNVRAQGHPTVRIYYVYEAHMLDPDLIEMILANSTRYSDSDLKEIARADAQQGGRGRANAVLALGLDELEKMYRAFPIDGPDGPVRVGEHQLDENVSAILR